MSPLTDTPDFLADYAFDGLRQLRDWLSWREAKRESLLSTTAGLAESHLLIWLWI